MIQPPGEYFEITASRPSACDDSKRLYTLTGINVVPITVVHYHRDKTQSKRQFQALKNTEDLLYIASNRSIAIEMLSTPGTPLGRQ